MKKIVNRTLNVDLQLETLKKINELNKKYFDENNKCIDYEKYHVLFDFYIQDFIRKLGYIEIADLYDEAHEYFWYS